MSNSDLPPTSSTPIEAHPNPAGELMAVADFCLIPMGLPKPSVGAEIAEVQRVLERSGLTYSLHGYGTNIEGPWDKVMAAIRDSHAAVHAMGCQRIATDIRIGTRTDKSSSNAEKVQTVVDILAKEKENEQAGGKA